MLYARSVESPSLEGVRAALTALAEWARNPQRGEYTLLDEMRHQDRERWKKRFRILVLALVAVWIVVSWFRSRLVPAPELHSIP